MKFPVVVLATAATAVAAAPVEERAEPNVFEMQVLATTTPIHFSPISASQSKILAGLAASFQDSQCDSDPTPAPFATFYIDDGDMYLYSEGRGEAPHVFIDSSSKRLLTASLFYIYIYIYIYIYQEKLQNIRRD